MRARTRPGQPQDLHGGALTIRAALLFMTLVTVAAAYLPAWVADEPNLALRYD